MKARARSGAPAGSILGSVQNIFRDVLEQNLLFTLLLPKDSAEAILQFFMKVVKMNHFVGLAALVTTNRCTFLSKKYFLMAKAQTLS